MNDHLFSQRDLSRVIMNNEKELLHEIDSIEGNRLLNTTTDDLCNYFEEKYKFNQIALVEDKITTSQNDTEIDVSQDGNRLIRDRSRPFFIKGTAVKFFIPFTGEYKLFECKSSSYTLNPPRALVEKHELVLTYLITDHNSEAIRTRFNNDLSEIKRWLQWINNDVTPFNNSVHDKARNHIEQRKQKLLKDRGLVADLGFPLRQRNDDQLTFVAPITRKKLPTFKPFDDTTPFKPEPVLAMEHYDHVLSIISSMVLVMERSPKAFKGMSEEDLRQHFLVQLNGHYEGQSTGETFNFEGKTDIIIRVENRNIFIAECKFWKGAESILKAIDQLFGYSTWRDSKLALLVFNKTKDFSSILSKIPEIIKSHPNYKKTVQYQSESGFRFIFKNKDDVNKELIFTVLLFNIPAVD